MKSIIKTFKRDEDQIEIQFEKDNQIIGILEETLQELKPGLKLDDYKKKSKNKSLENFWELDKKSEDINFTIISKKDFVKLKLKTNPEFIDRFLKLLEPYTGFSDLSPKLKKKFIEKGYLK